MFAYHQQCNHVRNSEIEGVTQNYARDSPIVLLYVYVTMCLGFFYQCLHSFSTIEATNIIFKTTDKEIFLLLL